MKAGTLIVVSTGTTEVEDFDPADFILRVNLGNPACFIPAGGNFDISNTDMVMLKPADTGVDGVAGGIHALTVGSSGSHYTQFTGRQIRSSTTLSTNNGTYAVNGQARLSDFMRTTEPARRGPWPTAFMNQPPLLFGAHQLCGA